MSNTPGAARRVRRGAAAVLLVLALLATGAAVAPAPAAATTTTTSVANALLQLTNRDRAARGLRPLRADTRLAWIAHDRATRLTTASTFSHSAAGGSLTVALRTAGVQWYAWAENLVYAPGGLRSSTAAALYSSWKHSPSHWAALMSRKSNYVGFGVAVRSSSGRVFASAVLTESRDHTAPGAKIDRVSRSGTTLTFAWHGYDAPLQTHWAGLRDFDVWYRVDDGAWRMIRDNTTATSIRLTSRTPGHRYSLMVRGRDRAYNMGSRCAPVSAWVP